MRILIAILILALAGAAATTASAADTPRFSTFQRQLIEAYARDQERITAAATRNAQAAQDAKRMQEAQAAAEDDHGRGNGHGNGHGAKGLPPGIAMNLERGKSLPPGIAKQRLPESLAKTLPAAPKGKEIVVVDGRVLLIDIATQQIHDRIENVFLR
jgi:hypothetical protein